MIIDTDNYSASGIEVIWFPGGEPHVKMEPASGSLAHIFAKIRNANDMLAYLAVCNSLEHQGVERHVFMPYLPGARQDRVQLSGAFTAEMYARMLHRSANKLAAFDVHSEDAADQFHRWFGSLNTFSAERVVADVTRRWKYDFIVSPDAGATEKTKSLADWLDVPRIIQCTKTRDPKDGKITMAVPRHPDADWWAGYRNCKILVADDICDGGATFLAIADQIRNMTRGYVQVDLYVSHGIFSKGLASLVEMFDNIFTTNSFYRDELHSGFAQPYCDAITKVDLFPYYQESLVQR